jgi:hypothetical protein
MKVLRAGFQVLAKPIVPAELITTIASTALRTPSICSSIALLGLAVVVMATFPRQRRGGGHQFHSMGSIGFDKCTSTPLCTARTRSSDRANPVNAAGGLSRMGSSAAPHLNAVVQTDPGGLARRSPRAAARTRLPQTANWRWAPLFMLLRRRGSRSEVLIQPLR